MNKFLSVVLLIGFIVTPIKVGADVTPAVQPSSQTSQVAADTPQSSYVPAATTYQNTDSIPILNNQAYDSSLYSSFIPQDAVQQYVSQYSGNGFSGQALEGFLIPTIKQEPTPVSSTSVAVLKAFLPGPKLIIALLTKLIAIAATAAGLLLFGGAITSFVCAFTPLCTITFFGRPLDLLRKETKDIVEKIGNEITTERIKRAAGLLKMAVERYENMQKN